ncbi:hypothetical protein B0T14DRAFT_535243 [Immersiella caudata]|uniref:Uncharacterized protein n=1 Tax=Immersiella caudata TaxID=314043 RepID=A0AA40C6W6_9PEZI|nr:hypothetical protein B0T14DRAFT_535243 [Immersiella caudata]
MHMLWSFWKRNRRLFNGDRTAELTHDAFAEYYHQLWHLIAGHGDGQYVATQSPEELNRVVGLIRQGTARDAILFELRSTGAASEEHCVNSINLAARLLTMIKFGVVQHQAPVLGCESTRLPKSFNAWTIEMIGGIRTGFTDNLADHLLLVEDDSKVLIFHHASFLEYQVHDSSVFLPGFVDGMLRKIAVLFSQSEVDPSLTLCGGNLQVEDRQIERFVFGRDRLVILNQAYDDATPKTIPQWWHDRRNSVQWYAFWVAVLVFVVTTSLGVIQCIEGALQVYMSYKTAD